MRKFKTGDVVTITYEGWPGAWGKGRKITLTEFQPLYGDWRAMASDGSIGSLSDKNFGTEEDYALSLLKEKGYTVTPPKPKRTGQVVIYRWAREGNNKYDTVPKGTWDKNFRYTPERTDLELIAIVDWTEGDGLEE